VRWSYWKFGYAQRSALSHFYENLKIRGQPPRRQPVRATYCYKV
jgi:hypothetical protein